MRHFWMVVRKDNPDVSMGCSGKRPYLGVTKSEMVEFLRVRETNITERRKWDVRKVWITMEDTHE